MDDNNLKSKYETLHGFKRIKVLDLNENAIKLIGYDWMLITAGKLEEYNTMTASWGGLGMLWNKPVAFIFIRPQRYTFEFTEKEKFFSCSFYNESYRDMLNFCGTWSGRDCNKAKEVNITPVPFIKTVAFAEAKIILECRKIYYQDINPDNFIAEYIAKHYPENDFHRMYVGEIIAAWLRD